MNSWTVLARLAARLHHTACAGWLLPTFDLSWYQLQVLLALSKSDPSWFSPSF